MQDQTFDERAIFNTVRPYIIRDGNTENCEIYLRYDGTKDANKILCSSLRVSKVPGLIPGKEHVYKSYTYVSGKFPNGTGGDAKIGELEIPTSETEVRVKVTGIEVFYTLANKWQSFSDVSGNWEIN